MPDQPNVPVARAYTPTALPSATARILAFLAIVLGGLCGGLIGYAFADIQCGTQGTVVVDGRQAEVPPAEAPPTTTERLSPEERGCATWVGVGAVTGAVIGAGGVAVISVLVLRAMAEWRRELDDDELEGPPVTGG